MSDYKGVVYTKEWVVNLMLDIAGYTTDKKLYEQVIVEPSCGHGSFLKSIVKRLLLTASEHNKLSKEIIIKCIRSFDLDPKAVEICRNMIEKELLSFGISSLDAKQISHEWVICDDYLLYEPILADYIIGNPPYLRATEIPPNAREKYVDRLSSMTKGCDIFVGFFQKGLESLKNKDSVLCYICADRWMQNQYGKKLRQLIAGKYHIDTLIKMHDVDAFEVEVSAYPAITKIDFGEGKIKYIDCTNKFSQNSVKDLLKWLCDKSKSEHENDYFSTTLLDQPEGNSVIPISSIGVVKEINELMERFPKLEDTGVQLGIGIATGKDNVFIVNQPDLVESDRMLPVFNMRNWRRTGTTDNNWLINPWEKSGELIKLDKYPKTKSYYVKHKDELIKRHVAKKNTDSWYRTIDKVNWSIYNKPMLLFPDMAMTADPVFNDGSKYPCHNCYWLISDKWDLKVLGGLLMSSTVEAFVDALGVKMRGGTKRFQAQYLRLIHVPNPDEISKETAQMLKKAFESGDRKLASVAAKKAYRLEG